MSDPVQSAPPPITSFPNYGGFFPSFPFNNLNSQFAASMQPFGGGYGAWGGMPYGGMGAAWPSLFGGGFAPPQYNAGGWMQPWGASAIGGAGGGFPFGSLVGGMTPSGGSATFNEGAPAMGGQASQQLLGAAAQLQPQPSAGAPAQAPAPQFGARPSWSAAQLAQANGVSPGLADFMLAHNLGADSNPANQQFYQAAGFTNPAGSQTMLNQAGRDWTMNNNQTYGNINADAGQPNGPRMRYGMTPSGIPYSYALSAPANNPALRQWVMRARGGDPNLQAPPPGVNLYSQFGPGG